ncbi:S-adenosyl-L-methionine-dependent methyltransferase [Fusarium avenaceum]|nr:S-adenosyl-L-methionine-dependent methyltransferase [Fusarium avenaceum]
MTHISKMASQTNLVTHERPEDVPNIPEALEAENNTDDTDSTLESGDGSSSYLTSLKSSIFSYRYENGRRYHAFHEGTYLVPNDEEEQSRMDLCHHIYSLLLKGKLHTAPIESPQRVLDLGTGTGIWAIDFADEHPAAEVVGTDLSPIQPDWVPANCAFEVDDFEDPWVYKRPFDYIHARELEGCIANEEHFFDQAFQNLTSGGYLELQAQRGFFMSDDDSVKKAVNAEVWAEAVRDSSSKFGKPIDCVTQWKSKMIKAGFEDVYEEVRKIPIGGWPKDPVLKEVGKCQVIQSCAAIDSYTPMLLGKILGWEQDAMQVLMAKAKKELRDPSIHVYLPVYFIWGKKP